MYYIAIGLTINIWLKILMQPQILSSGMRGMTVATHCKHFKINFIGN